MTKHFNVGDYVQWKAPGLSTEKGNIESIDIEDGWMDIWIGTWPNPHGGCRVVTSAKRVQGRWLAHRPYQGYLDRISRIKYSY